jgi:hypothetical protein
MCTVEENLILVVWWVFGGEREGEKDRKSPCDLFFEPLGNGEGRLDRNARVHANPPNPSDRTPWMQNRKKAWKRKEVERKKSKIKNLPS